MDSFWSRTNDRKRQRTGNGNIQDPYAQIGHIAAMPGLRVTYAVQNRLQVLFAVRGVATVTPAAPGRQIRCEQPLPACTPERRFCHGLTFQRRVALLCGFDVGEDSPCWARYAEVPSVSDLFKPVPWSVQNLVAAVESGALRFHNPSRNMYVECTTKRADTKMSP